jgi:hypothetical protein
MERAPRWLGWVLVAVGNAVLWLGILLVFVLRREDPSTDEISGFFVLAGLGSIANLTGIRILVRTSRPDRSADD